MTEPVGEGAAGGLPLVIVGEVAPALAPCDVTLSQGDLGEVRGTNLVYGEGLGAEAYLCSKYFKLF